MLDETKKNYLYDFSYFKNIAKFEEVQFHPSGITLVTSAKLNVDKCSYSLFQSCFLCFSQRL